jgi:hypothetical protein
MRTHDDDDAHGAEEREKKARAARRQRGAKSGTQDFHKWLRKIEKIRPLDKAIACSLF